MGISGRIMVLKTSVLLVCFVSAILTSPQERFTCDECVMEMSKLGGMIKEGATDIEGYLKVTYCPTLPDPAQCERDLTVEFVEAYMEDPVQVAEYTVWLAQNWCTSDHPRCPDHVQEHFPPMHYLAMEEFMIPVDICSTQPVCTGDSPTKPPTKPPTF